MKSTTFWLDKVCIDQITFWLDKVCIDQILLAAQTFWLDKVCTDQTTFWLDKVCIDQLDIARLPTFWLDKVCIDQNKMLSLPSRRTSGSRSLLHRYLLTDAGMWTASQWDVKALLLPTVAFRYRPYADVRAGGYRHRTLTDASAGGPPLVAKCVLPRTRPCIPTAILHRRDVR